jgi:flagellar hook-basal body complex protein FliE
MQKTDIIKQFSNLLDESESLVNNIQKNSESKDEQFLLIGEVYGNILDHLEKIFHQHQEDIH